MSERRSSRPSLDIVLRPPRPPRWGELARRGELLERHEPDAERGAPVETYAIDDAMWLIDGDLGEFRIDPRPGRIEAWPVPGVARQAFERRLRVDWLPIFYTVWGWQVVHAGAVRSEDTDRTIAFVGASGAGKSTLSYALGRRPGWTQLTDDATAFRAVGEGVELLPIPSESRLRPPSAERFGRSPWVGEELTPDGLGTLVGLYFLAPAGGSRGVSIDRLSASRALQELLEQAFAFTLKRRRLRQRMMEDYFTLAAAVPSFRLTYRKDFAALDALLEAVEEHADDLADVRASG